MTGEAQLAALRQIRDDHNAAAGKEAVKLLMELDKHRKNGAGDYSPALLFWRTFGAQLPDIS